MNPERPVLRWHGGKWMIAEWIASFFPAHHAYIEPYGGAASVLLRKPRCHSEIYNDLDVEVVNLFRVLQQRESAARLTDLLRVTPFAREEFELSYEPVEDPVERARRLVVRSYLGFSSDSSNKLVATGFRINGTGGGASPGADWANYPDSLAAVFSRFRAVMVENRPAIEVIKKFDMENSLVYADPPYVHSSRARAMGKYSHEMSDADHEELAATLHHFSGYVVISGYRSQLYDRLYGAWPSFDRAHLAQKRNATLETVWLNPKCAEARSQASLF